MSSLNPLLACHSITPYACSLFRDQATMRRSAETHAASKIDIHGVAARARVSIATVSRTINHVPTVDSRLAQRAWKAVAGLGHFPNTQARALVSGKSNLLGLI